MGRIGLVAGGGGLPLVFAKEAKRKGDFVVAFCLKGLTTPDLETIVDRAHWFEWGQFQKALFVLATERIKKIILIGKIKKSMIFRDEKTLDEKAKGLLSALKGKNDYSILKSVSGALGKLGIELIDVTSYLDNLIPSKGVLTARQPTEREEKDIEFGRAAAKELARLDIGQTVCVKDGCVVALEAAEGTDEAIRRAGTLSGGNFTIVKMARPDQDMRLDVPLVGPETVKTMIGAKASVLALEEKKTILMDREEVVALAERSGISIVII